MVCQRRLTECRHKYEFLWAIFYILWNMLSNLNHCQQSYATRWHMYTHVAFRHILFYRKNILQIRPGQYPNIKKMVFCTAKSTLRLNHNNKCVFFFYSLTPTPGHSFDLDLISEVSICCSQFWPSKFSTVTCSTVPGSRQCGATPYPSGLDLKKKNNIEHNDQTAV